MLSSIVVGVYPLSYTTLVVRQDNATLLKSFNVYAQSLSHKMPYLTIFGLFVEIWTVCSPEEAHGNGKS